MANSDAQITYTTSAPKIYKNPPIAGPTMIAVCIPLELKAIAFCNKRLGTNEGVNDCWVGIWNVRRTPSIEAIAKKLFLEMDSWKDEYESHNATTDGAETLHNPLIGINYQEDADAFENGKTTGEISQRYDDERNDYLNTRKHI